LQLRLEHNDDWRRHCVLVQARQLAQASSGGLMRHEAAREQVQPGQRARVAVKVLKGGLRFSYLLFPPFYEEQQIDHSLVVVGRSDSFIVLRVANHNFT
jgi:hypothetical protein